MMKKYLSVVLVCLSYFGFAQTNYVVTFKVNAANINVGANGMYLGKPFLAQAVAMSDPDGDGIWEATETLDGTAGGSFTFLNSPANNSNWATMENLTGLPCANPAVFNFRTLPTFSQDTTLGFCFGTCSPDTVCPAAPPAHAVTFRVNTANITVGPNGIFVGGGLYGSATGLALSDPDADGYWEGTDTLAGDGLGKFRFLNSPANSQNWLTQENIAGLPCADSAAFNDRTLPTFTQDTTLTFCFGTCATDCAGIGMEEATADFIVKPNPASDVLFIENTTGTASTVSVYNVTGAKVLADKTFQAEARMDVSALPRGLYIVRIQNGSTDRVVRVALK